MKTANNKIPTIGDLRPKHKDLSLIVLRQAIQYSCGGHLLQDALATSAAIYAAPLKSRPLRYHGVMAQKTLKQITIWDLYTETLTAQHILLKSNWDLSERSMCIARLGENYDSKQTVLTFSDSRICGLYEHQHRFIAVVKMKHERQSEEEKIKVQQIADIVAKNALAYYPAYLDFRYYCAAETDSKNSAEFPDFDFFLQTQPLRFVENINHDDSLVRNAKNIVTIGEFIAHHGEHLKQTLTIEDIKFFGDF